VGDQEETTEHALPVIARHLTLARGVGASPSSPNEPVRCGGVRCGGDVAVGDGAGVVCIPVERATEVAELGQGYARDDEAAAAELQGLTFSAAMAKFLRI